MIPSVIHIRAFNETSGNDTDGLKEIITESNTYFPGSVSEAIISNDCFEPKYLPSSCSYDKSLQCVPSSYSKITFHPSSMRTRKRTVSTITMKSTEVHFFCDWNPQLFGVDEDKIPSEVEEEEFGEFEEEPEMEEEPEKKPRYGRRARPKPKLIRDDGREFECICDIDETFQRHHISRFGGGIKSDKEEWRVPHISSSWEDYKKRLAAVEDASLLKFLEPRMQEESMEEKKNVTRRPYLRPVGKNVKLAHRRILESLRPLTCRELRRHRMAFSEAIILELEEDGFQETAKFLKSLIIEEYQLDRERKKLLTIRGNKSKLLNLVKLLTAAEKKGRKQEYSIESTILLKTGKRFSDSEQTWWWLAERLYKKAIEAASKCVIDGGKSKAIAHYIYGVYLLNYARKVRLAQEHLNKARELSIGRNWNASRIIEKAQESIECSYHLCRALIETSKELRKEGKPQEALRFIYQSYKLCQEFHSSRVDIEMETLFELGMTYQDAGELEWAKVAFKMFIAKAKVENCYKRICDGHLELAICYRIEGELNSCLYHLQSYLNHATVNNDENLKAFGNRYLGEFLLNQGYSHEAIEFFEKAFKSFLEQYERMVVKPWDEWLPEELSLPQDVEMARVLTGLAKGEILTKPICGLILRARDVRNQTDTLKLLKWKNSEEISFDLEEEYQENGLISKPETALSINMKESLTNEEPIEMKETENADVEEV